MGKLVCKANLWKIYVAPCWCGSIPAERIWSQHREVSLFRVDTSCDKAWCTGKTMWGHSCLPCKNGHKIHQAYLLILTT